MFHNFQNTLLTINGTGIFCTDAQISLGTQLSPLYFVGDRHSKNYAPEVGTQGNISFSYYLTGQDFIKTFITDETNQLSGNLGGLAFQSGYLTSYNLSCQPNKSVTANAEIIFFSDCTGKITPTYNHANETKVLNFSDITLTDPSNGSIGKIENVTSINYNFQSDVSAVYDAGSHVPLLVHFGEKSITANIEVDNYSGFMPFEGKNAGLNINFTHPHIPGLSESFKCSGLLYQRNISTSIGNVVKSNLFIKQNYVDDPPGITSLSTSALTPGGTFTINGTNLLPVTRIIVKEAPMSFTINSPTQITVDIPSGISSGDLLIYGAGGITTGGFVTVNQPALTVTDLNLPTGVISGNIQISGTNFYSIDRVVFATGQASPSFQVLSDTTIQAQVPNYPSWGVINVFSTERGVSGISTLNFVPVPIIEKITPISGVSGDNITIQGRGLSGITGVLFNNLPNIDPFTVSFTVDNFTGITATVPSGNVKGKIKLLGQSGVSALSKNDFIPIVRITGLFPASGLTGSSIVISGENFHPDLLYPIAANTVLVSFGQVSGEFTRVNFSRLDGTVPYGATTGPVYVYNSSQDAYSSTGNFTVIYPPPTVTGVIPKSGCGISGGSGFATILGTNFFDVTGVIVSGATGEIIVGNPNPTVISSLGNTISFPVPWATGDTYNIIVKTTQGDATGNRLFTIKNEPFISGITPISGAIGDEITISGLHLYNVGTKVYINTTGTGAAINTSSFNAVNTQVGFYIPTAAKTGTNQVIVYNGCGGYITGSQTFTLISKQGISGFKPLSGTFGDTISLSGSNLDVVSGMFLSGVQITTFNSINKTGITFTIPESAVTNFILTKSIAGEAFSTGRLAVYEPALTVSGFSPGSGYKGDTLYITGHRLNTAVSIGFTGVTFSGSTGVLTGLYYTGFTSVGITGLHITVPQNVKDGKITVRNTRVQDTSSDIFLVLPTPEIKTFWPVFGAYQDTINLSGVNFSGDTQFLFSNINANAYVPALNTTIIGNTGATLQVPREIISGFIKISGKGRNFGFSSGVFRPLPTISGIRPNEFVTGNAYIVTGINAAEIQPVVFITGTGDFAGEFKQVLLSFTEDRTNISGTHITDFRTGHTDFLVVDNSAFGGSGNIALVAKYYTGVTDTSSFIASEFSSKLSQISKGPVTIQENSPSIYGFTPTRGNQNTDVTITGQNFSFTTGIYWSTGSTQGTGTIISATRYQVNAYPPDKVFFGEPSGRINIVTRFGTPTYSDDIFTFIDSPYIDTITPVTANTGTWIRITGSGMNNLTGIFFGSVTGQYQKVVGPDGITSGHLCSGQVPYIRDGLPQTVKISIYNEAGSATGTDDFVIKANSVGFSSFTSSEISLPATTGNIEVSHGLGSTPSMVQWKLVNQTSEHGYNAGDEVKIEGLDSDTATPRPVFITASNDSIIWMVINSNDVYIIDKGNPLNNEVLTRANWKAKASAVLFD